MMRQAEGARTEDFVTTEAPVMRYTLRRHAVAVLTIFVLFAASRLDGAELPGEFLQQYAPAVEKLQHFYTHATVQGTLKREMPQAGKSLEQKFVFRAAGVQVRLDVSTVTDNGMGNKPGSSDMYMATRDGSLVTIRRPGSKFFDDARELNYGDTKTHIEQTCQLSTIYSFANHATLIDFLRSGDVKAVKVKRFANQGDTYYKISYTEIAGREDRPATWQSWFVLSPSEGWAMRGFSRTLGDGAGQTTFRGSLSYTDQQDGIPFISGIESVQERGTDRVIVERDSIAVSNVAPGDPAIRYFTAFDF
jgi:hypothetical protein